MGWGLWIDPLRYIRVEVPPEDIVPYLGPGRFTLAGQLFWMVLEHAESDCNHVHHLTTVEECNQSPRLRRRMGHSSALQGITYSFLKAMVEARLEYRKLGYISAEYASAAEYGTPAMLKRMVLDDYASQGKDSSVWLPATTVEQRARSLLGAASIARLEAAAMSADDTVVHKTLRASMSKLVENYICFGDGPRWNIELVDQTFSEWRITVGS
ncbi:uncharacterized protein JN550_005508 [Neoarthrinium moseri]|uniref:uncharacterized protein n=1 Tax=Neoarthrinium moseri TaxID=1658444 RepID=UPI001FDE5FED|nr:uncharacterized protein JN550_005508 [Neoarthrinium moseri]KAI1869918.1 hypothetical protein JN550_005508 [Neoarthrinium moseri]